MVTKYLILFSVVSIAATSSVFFPDPKNDQEYSEQIQARIDATDSLPAKLYFEALKKCFDEGKMPKYTIKRTYECHSLLQQGPCPDNQWFILRDDTAIAKIAIATCVDYPCQNTSYVPLVDTEKCQLIGDESPCQDGAVVVADYFGKGKCECQEGYLPYEDKCIKNGSQGPCQEQEIFTLTDDDQPLCELLDGARLALITLNKVCQDDERVGPKGDCIKINDAGLGTRSLGRSCLRCALNRLMNG